jgi:2-polyprenyl-3-methyl-5-hydroxy-6-metoxy-1,4-benzoquinol methylase
MNWHDTINKIRKNAKYADLVKLAYFDENLTLNIERFAASEEFNETMQLFKQMAPETKTILDIGAGNGISSINFALTGYNVTSVEPDKSDSVGANAIRTLKEHYKLENVAIYETYAEEINFDTGSFDIVYVRQAMHHAADLSKFVKECSRVLKTGGFLFTIRDHVVFDDSDKKWFLREHPLQKFYGGENAYTPDEYKSAMIDAGLFIVRELKFFDSVINYYPMKSDTVNNYESRRPEQLMARLKSKLGAIASFPGVLALYLWKNRKGNILAETDYPGRMYSYISQKI